MDRLNSDQPHDGGVSQQRQLVAVTKAVASNASELEVFDSILCNTIKYLNHSKHHTSAVEKADVAVEVAAAAIEARRRKLVELGFKLQVK